MPLDVRVLIVDDSPLIRRMLGRDLNARPGFTVVGEAMDPVQARARIDELSPDVLTLDLELPREDGLSFLRRLRRVRPIPTVVLSALVARDPRLAVECLEMGAFAVLAKPDRADAFAAVLDELANALTGARDAGLISHANAASPTAGPRPRGLPRPAPLHRDVAGVPHPGPEIVGRGIPRSLTPPRVAAPGAPIPLPSESPVVRSPATPALSPELDRPAPPRPRRLDTGDGWPLVVIGASTGGTEVLRDILAALPATSPAIAIVQHMPPAFTAAFADRLDQISSLEVREAAGGERIMPGRVLLAPGDRHMGVVIRDRRMRIGLTDGPLIDHHRPSITHLFDTTASNATGPVLAVMLTGMGADGADAMLRLRRLGAHTVAQDEATCVVHGMPKAAKANGAASDVADPATIAAMIGAFGRARRMVG